MLHRCKREMELQTLGTPPKPGLRGKYRDLLTEIKSGSFLLSLRNSSRILNKMQNNFLATLNSVSFWGLNAQNILKKS